jgi:hypothetical protein
MLQCTPSHYNECYNTCRNQYSGVLLVKPASCTKSPTEGAGGPSEPGSEEDQTPGNLVLSVSMDYAPEKEPNIKLAILTKLDLINRWPC